MKYLYVFIFSFFYFSTIKSQIFPPSFSLETAIKMSTGDYSPYYSFSNNHGIYSLDKNSALIRAGISNAIDTSKYFSLTYGLDGIYRHDSRSEVLLQQSFMGVKLKFLILQGGLFEEHFGNQDNQLSSGAFLYSENARPIPKIALVTYDYITLPFTNKLLEIKAYFAHGWFGQKDQYVQNGYLHQKYFYIRIGKNKYPWSVDIGLHHAAIWGGYSPQYGPLPAGWKAYKDVLFGKMKGDQGPETEKQNVVGDHLASYSLGINYNFSNYKLTFYWQTILEDKNGRVGIDWKNKGDGLWGLSIVPNNTLLKFKKLMFEFFNSTNQSGDPTKSGNDNYFNNEIYMNGWTFHKMSIGTPLITSPIYTNNIPSRYYITNNSVRAAIAGIMYQFDEKALILKITYTRNFGTIGIPFASPKDQIFSFLEYSFSSKKIKNLIYTLQGAFDTGSYLGNNAGIVFKVRKTF